MMDVQRLASEMVALKGQFPQVELRSGPDRTLHVKFALQTTASRVFVGRIELERFPVQAPLVFIDAPQIAPRAPHRYNSGSLCLMHPSFWNPGCHDLVFVMSRTAKWLNKYDVWCAKGTWPGRGLDH